MIAHRVLLLAAAASLIPCACPATAQVSDNVVISILRECAKIDDPTARLACYDNNIRQAGGTPNTATSTRVPSGGPAPIATSPSPSFGMDDVKTPRAASARPAQADEIRPRVASVSPREPGIYLITLEDGAQWLFAESVSREFRLPRRGDTIEIQRGALGSYLMRIDRQKAVAVRRTR
jgi:hypothetical protein